ncbi:MAG: WYL domain-containing protein [Treponemataceae bacterium]|nr:WYL domain-containing protein [Treponemataceae bacterium]
MAQEHEQKLVSYRILEMDKLIRNGEYPNSTTFKKLWGISRSTVSRYIEFLRDTYQAPLEFDPIKNGYYYTDNTFFIQNVMLSEGELFTVSSIMPLLEQYANTPLEASFKNIMNKVTSMLPDKVSVDSFFINNEIEFISDPLPKIEEEVFNSVFTSVRLHKTITFDYRNISEQNYKERKLDPYHVICQKGNWYVIGLSHDSGQIRIFALARMRFPEVTSSIFKFPSDFKLEKYIDPNFGIWNTNSERFKIELLFDKSISTYVSERYWHKTQQMKINPDGSVYLSFETNQLEETTHWIMQFCGAVKILSPKELDERVKDAARRILER